MSERKETNRLSFGEEEGKVWVIIKSGREKQGRVAVLLYVVFILLCSALISDISEDEEFITIILPLVVVGLLTMLVLFRFFGWYFFGRELFTIDGNFLSYSLKFGNHITTTQKHKYKRLSVRVDRIKHNEQELMGRLVFLETTHKGGVSVEVLHSTFIAKREHLLAFISFYENHKTKRAVITQFAKEISLN